MTNFNQREFRNALGAYTTGITVITTTSLKGHPVGITANSFTSVSLEPPLISWCLDNNSESYADFTGSEYFTVHVLHSQQQDVSTIFATPNEDKFGKVPWSEGEEGTPVLEEFLECFHCRIEKLYEGGDHMIILGRVVRLETKLDKPPLLYHQGKYKVLS